MFSTQENIVYHSTFYSAPFVFFYTIPFCHIKKQELLPSEQKKRCSHHRRTSYSNQKEYRVDWIRTSDPNVPNVVRYQLRYYP